MNAETSTGSKLQGRSEELKRVHAIVHHFANAVRARFGERVRDIWLYGSAARGDWTSESDIDVLVLLHREEADDVEWLVKTAYRLGLEEQHLLLQPVMLTTEEFDHLAARERRFARDILREGVAA